MPGEALRVARPLDLPRHSYGIGTRLISGAFLVHWGMGCDNRRPLAAGEP